MALDWIIRNQLTILALLLFFILAIAGLLYFRYRKHVKFSAIEKWLSQVAGLAVVPPMILGGGLSLASLEPIPKTSFLNLPEPICSKPANRKLLVFIHGWNGDPKDTWRSFPSLACADPRLSDVDVLVVNYPTYMVRRNVHLAELSDWLNKRLDATREFQRYERMAIISHSLGGLIGREMVINRQLAGNKRTFGLVISVASPFQGADIGSLGAALNVSQPLAAEAKPGSSFLATLTTHWDRLTPRPRTHCYSSPGDQVVPSSSALSGCDDRTIHAYHWGHQDLVKPNSSRDDRYALPVYAVAQFMASVR
ncbi:MAG: hypothetical protein IH604_20450 [Burkholderiales bacterium]|nr:hypothetical protein [Burkholderiales bacterium]